MDRVPGMVVVQGPMGVPPWRLIESGADRVLDTGKAETMRRGPQSEFWNGARSGSGKALRGLWDRI